MFFLGTTTLLWITAFSSELLFLWDFGTSGSNFSSMLFQGGTRQTFTCSMLTAETLEKGVKS